jgi:flagellar FliL protein
MSKPAKSHDAPAEGAEAPKKAGKKRLLLAVPVVLLAVVAGLWFSGILPPLLGMGAKKPAEQAEAAAGAPDEKQPPAPKQLVFMDLPEMVANLNAGGRRNVFVKLQAKLELSKPDDRPAITAAMPRLLDLFQTYLREMRPEDFRGSAGTYRLREELIARANIAVSPGRVLDILFTELLVQ